jgi:cyclic pyranopterin phosphate synthase
MSARRLEYLRLSVTERCRLRCIYCRPDGPPDWSEGAELTPGQLRFVVECAAAEGARKVRLTGGEPLERNDLEEIVAATAGVAGVGEVVLTTNGIGLAERAEGLKDAGLVRVNVSLDTLRPERFLRIAGADAHGRVMAGIARALDVFESVKLNAVLLRGINDDEIEELVAFAGRAGARMRLVERYPKRWAAPERRPLTCAEARQRVEAAFGQLVPVPADRLSVAEVYAVAGAGGATVGFIASATAPPCATCSKLRVSARGELLPCLFAEHGRAAGALIEQRDRTGLRRAMREVMAMKEARGRSMGAGAWPVGG